MQPVFLLADNLPRQRPGYGHHGLVRVYGRQDEADDRDEKHLAADLPLGDEHVALNATFHEFDAADTCNEKLRHDSRFGMTSHGEIPRKSRLIDLAQVEGGSNRAAQATSISEAFSLSFLHSFAGVNGFNRALHGSRGAFIRSAA